MKLSHGRALGVLAALVLAAACACVGATATAVAGTVAATARAPAPAPGSGPVAASTAASPFDGLALWVTQVPALATPQQLAAQARQAGARTLFVKGADGPTAELQLSAPLVAGLRAGGESVCAWTFAYGTQPTAEAAVAIAAVRTGAQCLVVDAEGQYDTRYGAAQEYVRALRAALGRSFPIALAGQAEVLEHPWFPYSVFLGPGGFDFDMPQIYWRELGVSVAAAFQASVGVNAIYRRPIAPIGQLSGGVSASEIAQFQQLAGEYRLPGTSFFDLDAAAPEALAALALPVSAVSRRAVAMPTLRAGTGGDEIVWAQELLNAAGARLPVGGFYGAQTERALARFQARHRLRASGVLGPATWRALLRLHPRVPSWVGGPPVGAREG